MQCKCVYRTRSSKKERRPAAKKRMNIKERERGREEKRRRREEWVLEWRTSVNIIQRLLYRTGTPYSLSLSLSPLRISPLSLNLEHPEFRWSIVIVIVSVFNVCLFWSTSPSPLLIYLLTLECKKNCTKQGDGKTPPRPLDGATLSSSVRNPRYQPISDGLPLRLEVPQWAPRGGCILFITPFNFPYSVYPHVRAQGGFLVSRLSFLSFLPLFLY